RYVGYTDHIGLAYGDRGGGLSLGRKQGNTGNALDRNSSVAPDERYDTLSQMQKLSNPQATWKIAVPNGTYSVHVVSGDPSKTNSIYKINVNGVLVVSGTPTSSKRWIEGTASITVTTGFVTVTNATGSNNNKIDYIDITQSSAPDSLLLDKVGDEKPGGDIGGFSPSDPAAAFATSLYRTVLLREPDASGLSGWVAALQ